jgi:hypothetical protein
LIEPQIGSKPHAAVMFAKQFGDLILVESIKNIKAKQENSTDILDYSDDESDESDEQENVTTE